MADVTDEVEDVVEVEIKEIETCMANHGFCQMAITSFMSFMTFHDTCQARSMILYHLYHFSSHFIQNSFWSNFGPGHLRVGRHRDDEASEALDPSKIGKI